MGKRFNKYIDCGDYYKIELYYPHSTEVCDYAIVSKDDVDEARRIYWRKTEYGYARGKDPYTKKDVLIHKLITKTTSEKTVDHINRNKLDCRRENMRIADSQINSLNRDAPVNSKTGYKGVSQNGQTGKYKAYIKIDQKQIYLGCFYSAESAHEARLDYENLLMGIITRKCKEVSYEGAN